MQLRRAPVACSCDRACIGYAARRDDRDPQSRARLADEGE
jgi:hypothetical protein